MATERPPLLDDLARVRPLVNGPLIVSHAFREAAAIEQALEGGADLVGHGARADRRPRPARQADCRDGRPRCGRASPATRTAGRSTRCCCARSTRTSSRPASRTGRPRRSPCAGTDGAGGRVAVVGAGPAGLECALTLARSGVEDVVLFETARADRRAAGDRRRCAEPVRLGAAAALLRGEPRRGRAPARAAGGRPGRLRHRRPRHRRRGDVAADRRRRDRVVGRDRGRPGRAGGRPSTSSWSTTASAGGPASAPSSWRWRRGHG